ncbi:hypothetical protein O3M35_008847 [Rhynocoris fuscipes]|uniref:Odorant receptor n=1 Tax=Rhynocoris fuscipes TaxID=488301 RepID=A0AAW1DAE6_9HEMI
MVRLIIITKESLDLPEMINLLHYATFNIGCLLTSIALLIKSNQFKDYCKLLEDEFKFPKVKLSAVQEKIMKDSSAYLVLFVRNSIPFYYCIGIGNALRGPLLEGTPLPYKGWLPFDNDTWPKHCFAFCLETLMALNVASNLYLCLQAYVIHGKQLCTQFDILCANIKDLFDCSDAPSTSNSSNLQREHIIKLKINHVIERHQVLLRCFNLFQEIYGGLLLMITVVSGTLICTNIFMITDPNTNAAVMLDFIVLLSPELISITFYSWYGQKITDGILQASFSYFNMLKALR